MPRISVVINTLNEEGSIKRAIEFVKWADEIIVSTYVRLWQIQQSEPLDKIYNDIDDELIKNNFNLK